MPSILDASNSMRAALKLEDTKKPIGRDLELSILKDRFKQVSGFKDGGIVVFEGETGIGKSRMCYQVHRSGVQSGFLVVRAECVAEHSRTPYYPMQQAMEEFFGVQDLPAKQAREKVRAQLEEEHPELWGRIALLNAIVPLGFEETFETRTFSAAARMENTKRLLLDLFQNAADSARRLVLVFEDVHWMDSLTWSLLADIATAVKPLLLVVTHRLWTEDEAPPVEYDEIVQMERADLLCLRRLTRDESEKLVCRLLRAKEVPEVLLAVVINRASGNPFFIGELVRYLVSANMITVKKRIAMTGDAFGGGEIPSNAFAMSSSRFALLAEPLQLLLKVASVLESAFNATIIRGVHPMPHMCVNLEDMFLELQHHGYLELSSEPSARLLHIWSMNSGKSLSNPACSQLWKFSHSMFRDVIYSLVPARQQKELHRNIARFFESSQLAGGRISAMDAQLNGLSKAQITECGIDPPIVALTLAHHWSNAEESYRASKHCVAAGWDALLRFGNSEAVDHFQDAFELANESPDVAAALPRAKLIMLAGEAFFSRGVTATAGDHYRESLMLNQRRLEPAGPVQLAVRVMLVQMYYRGARLSAASDRRRQAAGGADVESNDGEAMDAGETTLGCIGIDDCAHCYERLAQVHQGERWLSLYYSLMQLRLLQALGSECPPAAILRAVSTVCSTASKLGLCSHANRFAHLAQNISVDVHDATSLSIANRQLGAHMLGQGSWAEADAMLDAAVSLGSTLHDWHGWYESLSYVSISSCLRGRFDRSARLAREVLTSVMMTDNESSHAVAFCTLLNSENAKGLVTGESLDTLCLLEALLEPLQQGTHVEHTPTHLEPHLLVAGHGNAALARYRRGELVLALHHVTAHLHLTNPRADDLEDLGYDEGEEGEDGVDPDAEPDDTGTKPAASSPTSVFTLVSQFAVCETCVGLWEQSFGRAHEMQHISRRALQALRRAARTMPMAQARVHLYAGHVARLEHRHKLMVREWEAALKCAVRLGLPFEQGCTHAALATWSGATPQTRNPDLAGEQRRRANLCAAREAFCSLGGSFVELQRADAVAIRMKSNPARFPVVRGRRSTDMWPRLRAKGLSLAWLCAGKGKDR